MINKVTEGCCLEIMREIPDASVDMILCDLPYGTTSCKWDAVIPFGLLWQQYWRVVKQGAAIVLTASQPFSAALVMSQPDRFRHEWVWIKNAGSNFANTMREPMKEHESVLVFSQGGWTYNRQMQARTGGGAARVKTPVKFETGSDNYRRFERVETKIMPELRVPSSWQKFNRERGLHPTQKPVDLFQYLIRTYSNPGDLVLDNCIGSGTTAIAAILEHRRFIGIEKDRQYAEVARRRVTELVDVLNYDLA